MKDMVDYIKYHGTISSIRDKVDKDYIWFDICQKEPPVDKDDYWNGKKIEKIEATKEEQQELQRLIDEIVGVRNE